MANSSSPHESIPFYRNVKTISILAQIVFLIVLLIAIGIIVRNVIQGVKTLGVPADFGWIGDRSGIPLSESPIPYDENIHPYRRVLWIGFLNTLKIAIPGVVLATLLGIAVALMRLSKNWILRQIGTVYVETVRNIPLAIQIFFWYSVILIPNLPIGVNALGIGDIFLNNSTGLSIPWLYPSQNFGLFLPWLLGAIGLAVLIYLFRRRQIFLSERPGNPWTLTLAGFLLVAGIGYLFAQQNAKHPEGLALDFNAGRGRLSSYIDANGNESKDRNEQGAKAIAVTVSIDSGYMEVIPDKRTEIGQVINSGFRFARLQSSEFSKAEVTFVNPVPDSLKLHFDKYPSIGQIYSDRNNNGTWDKGEELRTAEEIAASGTPEEGYEGSAYTLRLSIEGFKRRLVTDAFGETRFPRFQDATNPQTLLGAATPLAFSRPSFPSERTLMVGGQVLSNSYMALLLALVIYTASFIAEIVRGGILSVSKGQSEASKALGLSNGQTFNLVVFPQAMRIIIPPLISNYLNLTKNSSLGFLAAYPEFFKISEIVSNQSGATVPTILLLMAGYLLISFSFSIILNFYNARVRLVER